MEREPKLIHIYKFEFTEYTEPFGKCVITCTKGTYVRSLAHELGGKVGCGAHLAELRRTRSGKLDVANAIKLDELLKLSSKELESRVIPVLKLVE